MKSELLSLLRSPDSGNVLSLDADAAHEVVQGEILSGWLVADEGKHHYPIRNGIPRFVPESNYADNFGMQWNHFAKTQLDSHSGHLISAERFWQATGWEPADLEGRWVLDVGCGSGRFAEIALSAGARLVALDYSSAVDACHENLKQHPNLHVVQGDIYALPLARQSFDYVYSLGVLQHTPDVERAFDSLPPMLKPGGRLCVDYYERTYKSAFLPKYWLRPITRRMPQKKLFSALERIVPLLLPVSRALGRIPAIGHVVMRIVPVVNYEGMYPLTEQQLREWALLDTFDMFAPAYDQPQKASTVFRWLEQAGLREIELARVGHLVGRGVR